jgi:hypothetical protein
MPEIHPAQLDLDHVVCQDQKRINTWHQAAPLRNINDL